MYSGVHGLEDASKDRNLIVELLLRGWNIEIYRVMAENLMCVMDQVDTVAEEMNGNFPRARSGR